MCVKIETVTVTNKPIIAYKKVERISSKSGRSTWSPRGRDLQDGCKTAGKLLTYTIGKTVVSGDPGIYLYARRPLFFFSAVMRVEIPDGTVIARGTQEGIRAILAERINVLGWA